MTDLDVKRLEIVANAEEGHRAWLRWSCPTLDALAGELTGAEGVAIDSLETGTTLLVRTRNSQYRFLILDGPQGRVLVTGGTMFPEATPVRLAGSTGGGSALKVGWIVIGLRMEMRLGGRRITSSPVCSVAVEPVPGVPAARS